VILNFSIVKTDASGKLGEDTNYAELNDKKIRRAIIFREEGKSNVDIFKSTLEKIGFQVHLIELQYLLPTLQKSITSHFIFS